MSKNMTNKELLTMAAKIAGIEPEQYEKDMLYGYDTKTGTCGNLFDPLNSNEDAFKLMVQAQLNVIMMGDAVTVEYLGKALNIGRNEGNCKGDLCHAVRLAIVIAAAEMGMVISNA